MHDTVSTFSSSKQSASHLFAFLVIGLATFFAVGCQKAPPPIVPPKPPEVVVASPTSEEVLDFEETTGRLVALKTVDIRSRVSGYLDEVFFKDGQMVEQDQQLIQIDARPYKAELDRAKANYDQTKTRLDRLKRQEERARKLFGTKNTTQEDLDQISADRAEAEAMLDGLKSAVELANLNYGYTKILSPISGRISRRMIDPGNLIKADDTMLVTVMSLNPIYAYFDIDERTVLRIERLIREGKIPSPREAKYEVTFALADETDFTHKGAIDFLDNHLSATTGTLRLRASVENENLLLTPGMFIRVHVPVGKPHPAILIPEAALGSDQGQRFVYALDKDNKITYRRVKIGTLKEGRRVVIEEGLTVDDRIVVSGLQRVRVGIEVQPKTAESAAAEKTALTKPETEPSSASAKKEPTGAGSVVKQ